MPKIASVVSNMDHAIRRVLEEEESDEDEQQRDGLAQAEALCHGLNAARDERLRASLPPGMDLHSQKLVQDSGAIMSHSMKRLDPFAGLQSGLKRLAANKFDHALALQPDYGDPAFLHSINSTMQHSQSVIMPAYFAEYANMKQVVAAASLPISAFPRTDLSYSERVRLNKGTLFTSEPLTKFSHTARGAPKKSRVRKMKDTQVTAMLGPK
jgi:hypothetical protein